MDERETNLIPESGQPPRRDVLPILTIPESVGHNDTTQEQLSEIRGEIGEISGDQKAAKPIEESISSGYFEGEESNYFISYERYTGSYWDLVIGLVREYLPRINKDTRLSILDVGCASGNLDEALLQDKKLGKMLTRMGKNIHICGVDYNKDALDVAQKRVPQGHYVLEDLNRNNIEDVSKEVGVDKFAVIIALDVLEHMKNPARRQEILQQLVTHLADDGFIIIGMPEQADPNDPWYLKAFKNVWNKLDGDSTHYSKPTTSEFTQDVEDAGLKIKKDLRYFPIPQPGQMIEVFFSGNRMVLAIIKR